MLAQNIPPEFFPRLVLYLIAMLAALLPFEHIAHARQSKSIDAERSDRIRRLPYMTSGLVIVVAAAMPYIGTFLAMVVACILLPLLWGERNWKRIVPFAVIFPLAVAAVFNGVLRVYFEPGVFNISL